MAGASNMQDLVGPLVAIAIWIVLFLLFRVVVLWYWKINKLLEQLQQINEKLGRMVPGTPRSSVEHHL
jgi:hypothetical protein